MRFPPGSPRRDGVRIESADAASEGRAGSNFLIGLTNVGLAKALLQIPVWSTRDVFPVDCIGLARRQLTLDDLFAIPDFGGLTDLRAKLG